MERHAFSYFLIIIFCLFPLLVGAETLSINSIEDAMFDEDSTRDGTNDNVIADLLDGTGELPFFKFDISSLPSGCTVDNATLRLWVYPWTSTSDEILDVWYVDNQSWDESEIDPLCGNGVVCSEVYDLFTTKIRTWSGADSGEEHYEYIDNLQTGIQAAVDAGDTNVSFALNHTGDATDFYGFRTKEYGTVAKRPNLIIGYTEGSSDTCTYIGSGNWNIDCSDNCVLETSELVAGNISLFGEGNINISSLIMTDEFAIPINCSLCFGNDGALAVF